MGEVTLQCVVGDITEQSDVDVIVNWASPVLMDNEGGVSDAIHAAAGPELAKACTHFSRLSPGEAVLTEAFDLPNIGVIHCIGPIDGRDEAAPDVLTRCYENALKISENEAVSSISFPTISSDAFGYPLEDAAAATCKAVVQRAPDFRHLRLVRFLVRRQSAYQVYSRHLVRAAAELTGPSGQVPKPH